MSEENNSLTPFDLRRILVRFFDEEELQDLTFDLKVDYESLPAQGKAGKARELVELAERVGQLDILEAAIRRERPSLDTAYSAERTQQLQLTIMESSDDQVRGAFVEFTKQIDAYINEFSLLQEKMEEWKEVHNLLQDMQNYFAPCRSYIYAFNRVRSAPDPAKEREKLLYEIEVEWRPCKRVIRRLENFASTILAIGEPYNPDTGVGPDWYLKPKQSARRLDRSLFEADLLDLRENLSDFGDVTDQYLYLADKSLLKIANEIMSLPRPSSYSAKVA